MRVYIFLAVILLSSGQVFAKDEKTPDRYKELEQRLKELNFPNARWWTKWEDLIKKYEAGLVGPQGPAGPQGPVGPQGPAGPQGPRGLPGPKGDQGIAGPQGGKGDQGLQGPMGLAGANGEKGDQGAVGLPGAKGDKGDQGIAGPQGPIGLPGVRGDSGATGPQGIQGPKGDSADPAELSALKDQISDLKTQNSILMQVVNALRPCSGSVSFSNAASNHCTVIEGDLVFDSGDDQLASQNGGIFYGDIRSITEVKGSILIRNTAIVERIYYGFPSLTKVGGSVVYSTNQNLISMISSNFLANIGSDLIFENMPRFSLVMLSRLRSIGRHLIFKDLSGFNFKDNAFSTLISINGNLLVSNLPVAENTPFNFFPTLTSVVGSYSITGTMISSSEIDQFAARLGK